jgi:hypothetical protein
LLRDARHAAEYGPVGNSGRRGGRSGSH